MATKICRKLLTVSALIVFTASAIRSASAGMLYVANHLQDYDYISQFAINGSQLTSSGTIPVPRQGWGMVDIAVDPCEGIAFISHEGGWDPFEER